MSNFDLFAASNLLVSIRAAHASGDFGRAQDLASVAMGNSDDLLCRIEDGQAPEYANREKVIAQLWSDTYSAKIDAQNAARA